VTEASELSLVADPGAGRPCALNIPVSVLCCDDTSISGVKSTTCQRPVKGTRSIESTKTTTTQAPDTHHMTLFSNLRYRAKGNPSSAFCFLGSSSDAGIEALVADADGVNETAEEVAPICPPVDGCLGASDFL
jgi:hypothetical protein